MFFPLFLETPIYIFPLKPEIKSDALNEGKVYLTVCGKSFFFQTPGEGRNPPARMPVTNEGLGWDSLLKMECHPN